MASIIVSSLSPQNQKTTTRNEAVSRRVEIYNKTYHCNTHGVIRTVGSNMKGMKFVKETKKTSEPSGIQRKCSPMKNNNKGINCRTSCSVKYKKMRFVHTENVQIVYCELMYIYRLCNKRIWNGQHMHDGTLLHIAFCNLVWYVPNVAPTGIGYPTYYEQNSTTVRWEAYIPERMTHCSIF